MTYLATVLIIVLGMSSKFIVELSSELSTNVLMDTDAGVDSGGTQIIADQIVDMRPETSIGGGPQPDIPHLLAQDR
jgi:hypothetical protein